MTNFQIFWHLCEAVLREKDFTWPEGVTFVNYPDVDYNIYPVQSQPLVPPG